MIAAELDAQPRLAPGGDWRALPKPGGLSLVRRFSEALLLRGEERLELRFGDAGETRSIAIPLWTLEGQDIEPAGLWLLAELQERGYRVRLKP